MVGGRSLRLCLPCGRIMRVAWNGDRRRGIGRMGGRGGMIGHFRCVVLCRSGYGRSGRGGLRRGVIRGRGGMRGIRRSLPVRKCRRSRMVG